MLLLCKDFFHYSKINFIWIKLNENKIKMKIKHVYINRVFKKVFWKHQNDYEMHSIEI